MTHRTSTASRGAKAADRRLATPQERTPAPFVAPYPPSWLDRLTAAIDRLPGPSWLAYLVWTLAMYLLLSSAHWLTGGLPVGTFDRVHLLMAGAIPISLLLIDYLDREAVKALEEFRPALRASEDESLAFRYRLVTIPSRVAIWAALTFTMAALVVANVAPLLQPTAPLVAGSADPLVGGLLVFHIGRAPATTALGALFILAFFATIGAAVYHIANQMVTISHILTHHAEVDLFGLAPLYAFSRHTARTSIVLVAANLAGSLLVPEAYRQLGIILINSVFLLLVVAAFVLPLSGAHRLMAREKELRLTQNGAMLKATVSELHRRVTTGRLRDMDNMNKTLASLEIERSALLRIPTWPWEPGTVRSVAAAILLPLFLYVVQQILARTLGG